MRHFASALLAAFAGLGLLAACGGEPGREAASTVTVTVVVTETAGAEPAPLPPQEPPPAPPPSEPAPPPAPTETEATVLAGKSGLAQSKKAVGYGIVLRNPSETDDALSVTVTVNVLDAKGNILASDSGVINVVPAGATYYFGGETFLEEGGKAAELEPIIDVDRSAPAEFPLPPVRRVRASVDEFGSMEVRGEVENTLERPLSQIARIGVVLFGEDGKVVGGGFAFLNADLPSGRRAGFVAFISAVPAVRVTSAKASIENEVAE